MAAASIQPPPQVTSPPAPGVTRWTAPRWVQSSYSRFPLVTLEQEDTPEWTKQRRLDPDAECSLWVEPPREATHQYHRTWASPHPPCLRTQLLFLLRDPPVRVQFRPWSSPSSAPGGTLPALHLPIENRLISSDEIRPWLDSTHPIKGKGKELQGMPSQEAYDRALSLAQLVLTHLYPAYLASLHAPPSDLHLYFSNPPPLAAGLTTPLPAALTGDTRDVDVGEVVAKGVDAVEALEAVVGPEWALGARRQTPLDALIASHLYGLYGLPESSPLRSALDRRPALGDYVDRVLTVAGANA
ncbi:hypothetical protein JCM24511_09808 [Saitozyma sp. JCM 24511]|nr:hypothetical protein JCM24511_09808 [Saitozyma sp. JCM 24511]